MAFSAQEEAILKAIAASGATGTPIDGKPNLALGNVVGTERLPVSAGTDTGGVGAGATDRKITFDTLKTWFFNTIKKLTFTPQTAVQQPYLLATFFYDSDENTWTFYNDISGISLQLGEELRARLVNDTGATLFDGKAVSVIGAVGASLKVELTDASDFESSVRGYGIMTHTVINGNPGYAVRYGAVRDIDTSLLVAGNLVYADSDDAGELTSTRPAAPNYPIRLGMCLVSDVANGVLVIDTLSFNGSDTGINLAGTLNGICTQTPNVVFSVNGGIIYADVTNELFPTKNLPFLIGGLRYLLDTTTVPVTASAQIVVPPGASTVLKQKSFIHIILNAGIPELAVSTVKPSVPHAMICDVTVYNAARTVTDGKVFAYRRQNNASSSETEGIAGSYGFTRVLADDARSRGSAWDEGQVGTPTVSDITIKLALSAGVGKQLHYSSIPLFSGNLYQIYNDDTNAITYEDETDLINIVDDSNGNTLLGNGFYYALKVYYKLNSNGIGNDVIITRPSGHYSTGALAISDGLGYTTNLADTDIEDIVYPVYIMIIAKTGGGGTTTALFDLIDLRSKTPGVGGGTGGAPPVTDDKIRISAADTTNDYLNPKIAAGSGIIKTILNPGANEQLEIKTPLAGTGVANGGVSNGAQSLDGLKTFLQRLSTIGRLRGLSSTEAKPTTGTGVEIFHANATDAGNIIAVDRSSVNEDLKALNIFCKVLSISTGDDLTVDVEVFMVDEDGIVYILETPNADTDNSPLLARKASTGEVVEIDFKTQTSVASSATLTPTGASKENEHYTTALAVNAAYAVPSGTPANGNNIMGRVKDDGTPRTLAFNAIYRAVGVTIPTTTVANKTLYWGAIYNSEDSKWDIVSVVQEV